MPHQAIKHLVVITHSFLLRVLLRLQESKHDYMKGAWLRLNESERIDLSWAIISEFLRNDDLNHFPQISVKWAGCHFRDFNNHKEATAFAEALAMDESNLPVLIQHSITKAGWHNECTAIAQTAVDPTLGDMRSS